MDLNFETVGNTNGVPLMVLHGLFGAGRNWRSIAKRIAAAGDYCIYLVDLRNHGGSPWRDGMSYKEIAEDLVDFVEARELPRVYMLGHSMGGKAVMRLLLQEPQLCCGAVICDIAPVSYPNRFSNLLDAMLALPLEYCRNRDDADRFLGRNVPHKELRQFLLQSLLTTKEGYQWGIHLEAIRDALDEIHDFPEPLQGVHFPGPTLFLRGMDSDYILPEHRGEILRLFPQAEILGVPDAGHWLHSEQPDLTAARVVDFLLDTKTIEAAAALQTAEA